MLLKDMRQNFVSFLSHICLEFIPFSNYYGAKNIFLEPLLLGYSSFTPLQLIDFWYPRNTPDGLQEKFSEPFKKLYNFFQIWFFIGLPGDNHKEEKYEIITKYTSNKPHLTAPLKWKKKTRQFYPQGKPWSIKIILLFKRKHWKN